MTSYEFGNDKPFSELDMTEIIKKSTGDGKLLFLNTYQGLDPRLRGKPMDEHEVFPLAALHEVCSDPTQLRLLWSVSRTHLILEVLNINQFNLMKRCDPPKLWLKDSYIPNHLRLVQQHQIMYVMRLNVCP